MKTNEKELIAFFEDLHQHPELGFQEKRTTEKVLSALHAHGIRTLETGTETGAVAVIEGKKPGRVIGLRCDMDALPIQEETGLPYASLVPGRMHACGHDFHTAAMLGAAIALKEREEELAGTVKIVFQPSEELSGGGRMMAALEALWDIEEFYALHTYPGFEAGTLGIKAGPVMAAPDGFSVVIRGKGAHAGNPHLGVDPIPALVALAQSAQNIITRSKDAFEPAVLSITHIQAGTTWNVVPEEGMLEGTARAFREETRDLLRSSLERMADCIARAHGCTAEFRWVPGPDPVINDPALCDAARNIALEMGFQVAEQANTMGGEDFSEYLKRCPGALIRVGTGGGYPNHHPKFTADSKALWPAAQFFARLAQRRAAINN